MTPRPEFTALQLRVLSFLIVNPKAQGADLMHELEMPSGTLYPLLRKLAESGLLLAEVQAFGSGRTLYSVTETGSGAYQRAALALIEDLQPALDLLTKP